MSVHDLRAFYVETVFSTDEHTHDHLREPETIRQEVQSWLQSLNADVQHISVRPADAKEEQES
jgi:hypothetical protein